MVNDRFKISPYLALFVISTNQIGVGVLGFQRIIAKSAGHDSWIAIILAALCVHFLLFIMYMMLKKTDGDIINIHQNIFGKLIGNFLSNLFIVYLIVQTILVLRTYLEVLQVWMFPELNIWVFSFYFLGLAVYIISGGFRVVVGICFFSIVLPLYLWFSAAFPLEFSSFRNLLPIFDHSIKDMALATKDMTLSIIGFEIILVFYPFIKNPEKSHKWAHFGVMYTTLVYLVMGVTALIFFSPGQLEKTIWATLSMWKIVQMPIVERFEYIGIASWMLVVLPNVCLSLWGASRLLKKIYNVKQKYMLWAIALFVLIISGLLTNRKEINVLNEIYSQVGFYFLYLYIPFLFIATLILYKVRNKE